MRNGLAAWGLMAAACLGLSGEAQGAGCAPAKAAAARVDAARQALLALPLANKSGQVPEASQQAVATMKAALSDFIGATVRCSDANVSAENLEEALSEATHATEVEDPDGEAASPDAGKYGHELIYEVKRWPKEPKLLSISAAFSIECSMDTLLVVYDASSGAWAESMRWQSEPYDRVSGGFFSMDYQVSPPDASGHWYVLAKHIAPACASTWSTIDYALLRPQSGKAQPRVLFSAQRPIWWGGDDYGELTTDAAGFEVRFHGPTLDASMPVRLWVERHALAGDSVKERTAPIALSPLDFIDEWLREPWQEALRWTDPNANPATRELHGRWQKGLLKYASLRRCASEARYELTVVREDGSAKAVFAIAGEGAYRLLSAEDEAPLCRGSDIPLR